jgi:hypothetical protein
MNELGLGGRFAIAGFAVLAMGACEYLPEVSLPSLGPAPLCSGNGLRVETDFPGAGRHDCIIAPDGSIVVSVDHEPTFVEGINPSPWFAFKVTGESPREATITLDYTDYNHRYAPWIKREGAAWAKLNEANLTLNERKTPAGLLSRGQCRLDPQRPRRPWFQRDKVRNLARRARTGRLRRRRRH